MGIYEDIQKAHKVQEEIMGTFFGSEATPDLVKRIETNIQKGKKAEIGEVRMYSGKPWVKVSSTGNPNKDWQPQKSVKGNAVEKPEEKKEDDGNIKVVADFKSQFYGPKGKPEEMTMLEFVEKTKGKFELRESHIDKLKNGKWVNISTIDGMHSVTLTPVAKKEENKVKVLDSEGKEKKTHEIDTDVNGKEVKPGDNIVWHHKKNGVNQYTKGVVSNEMDSFGHLMVEFEGSKILQGSIPWKTSVTVLSKEESKKLLNYGEALEIVRKYDPNYTPKKMDDMEFHVGVAHTADGGWKVDEKVLAEKFKKVEGKKEEEKKVIKDKNGVELKIGNFIWVPIGPIGKQKLQKAKILSFSVDNGGNQIAEVKYTSGGLMGGMTGTTSVNDVHKNS